MRLFINTRRYIINTEEEKAYRFYKSLYEKVIDKNEFPTLESFIENETAPPPTPEELKEEKELDEELKAFEKEWEEKEKKQKKKQDFATDVFLKLFLVWPPVMVIGLVLNLEFLMIIGLLCLGIQFLFMLYGLLF